MIENPVYSLKPLKFFGTTTARTTATTTTTSTPTNKRTLTKPNLFLTKSYKANTKTKGSIEKRKKKLQKNIRPNGRTPKTFTQNGIVKPKYS